MLQKMAVALEQLAAAEAQPRCGPLFIFGGGDTFSGATIGVVYFFWVTFLGVGWGKKSRDVAGC